MADLEVKARNGSHAKTPDVKNTYFVFTHEANKRSAGLGCINLVERVLAAARRAVIDSSVIV